MISLTKIEFQISDNVPISVNVGRWQAKMKLHKGIGLYG